MSKIKVLIVDDSALVRKILSSQLSMTNDIEVIGVAQDPYIARDKIVQLKPDVLLLDIEMPRMDGLTFLETLMLYRPMPVVIVSSLAKHGGEVALRAFELGAVEVVAKPGTAYSVADMSEILLQKVRAAAVAKLSPNTREKKPQRLLQNETPILKTTDKIVAIGSSTGGVEALQKLLPKLPPDMSPIVIAQHMPPYFTKTFAQRLDSLCSVKVKEASDGELLAPGKVLIAPGNRHLELRRDGARYYALVHDKPRVSHQRPSVDTLFHSVAAHAGKNSVGVILTGMGKDGAQGLMAMRNAGAMTIAQDEQSCVIFGMPKEAIALGAARKILSLQDIPLELIRSVHA